MQPFMGKDFMLKNETAKHLFHTYSDRKSMRTAVTTTSRKSGLAEKQLTALISEIIISGALCVPTVCRKMS